MSQNFSNNYSSINIGNSFNYTASDYESKILARLSPLGPWARHRDIGAERVDGIGARLTYWKVGSLDDGIMPVARANLIM